MKRKFLLSMVVLLLLTIYTSTNAYAVILNIRPVKQAKDNWCWAAGAEMAGAWAKYSHDPRRTQWDIVKEIKGSYIDETAKPYETVAACEYACYDRYNFQYKERAWSFADIYEKIDDEAKTLLVSLGDYQYGVRWGGHILVLNGVKIRSNEIYYTDPKDGKSYWIDYDDFKNGGYGTSYKYDRTFYY